MEDEVIYKKYGRIKKLRNCALVSPIQSPRWKRIDLFHQRKPQKGLGNAKRILKIFLYNSSM